MVVSLGELGVFTVITNTFINLWGWRMAFIAIGLMELGIMFPIAIFGFRNAPERYGLLPDGPGAIHPDSEAIPLEDLNTETKLQAPNWTLREAIKTVSFWTIALSISVLAMLSTGLMFFLVSILNGQGAPAQAQNVFVPLSLTSAVLTLVSGFVMEHVDPKYLLAVSLVLLSLCLIVINFVTTIVEVVFYGMLLGICLALKEVVFSLVWAHYFGRESLGVIMGTASTIHYIGAALGPMVIGVAWGVTGTYTTVLYAVSGIPILFAIATLIVKKPEKPVVNEVVLVVNTAPVPLE